MGYGSLIVLGVLGFMASLVLTSGLIPFLQHKQAGQNIRMEGPKSHQKKAGTPSMGGIAIIISTTAVVAIGGFISKDIIVTAAGFIGFGIIGFVDDYIKVVRKNNLGLRAWQKMGLQVILAVAISIYIAYFTEIGTEVFVPFVNEYVDFGVGYVPFIVFTILAMVNAVNLTDGLDGLASGTTAIVALFLAMTAVSLGASEAGGFLIALTGACLGFLAFNKNPAKIFMGDTGSLALGGGLVVAAIIMKLPLILPIVGIIYVLEVLSVCIQVISFKLTGKRVFKMAPLHHHFELSGMKETQVVMLFWVVTVIFCVIGQLAI